jgi:hypothetical protein
MADSRNTREGSVLRLTVTVDLAEPTGMAASAALRRAFLSSTVDVRSYVIHSIEVVDEPADAQLSLLDVVG